MRIQVGFLTIECLVGDIAHQPDIDVIVNAANAQLAPGGGVAGAVHSAAGPGLYEECQPLAPIAPGQAVCTGAHDLPNTWVVHCLGPVYGVDEPAPDLLRACYRRAVRLADEQGARTIAFPAISTGAFGYPFDAAAEIAVGAVAATPQLNSIQVMRFVLFDERSLRAFERAMEHIAPPIRDGCESEGSQSAEAEKRGASAIVRPMSHQLLEELGIANDPRLKEPGPGGFVETINPTTGSAIATVGLDDLTAYHSAVERAGDVFTRWRMTPAPVRGELIRKVGLALRDKKDALGALVALEMGKIRVEGEGEVQEAIDIADFAVGLSRQLYGLTIASERPEHRMFEQWQPLGPIGIITAFNFPVAVWAWNAMVAAVCGDTCIWKPSLVTPLTSMATHKIARDVAEAEGFGEIFQLIMGADDTIGETMIADARLPLISATGSCRMGSRVGAVVGGRLGRALLELGGNNALTVLEDANMELATRGIVFGAVGTAGQRCTSTRRVLAHSSIADDLCGRLVAAYKTVSIGDPLEEGVIMGPLISPQSVDQMMIAIEKAKEQGGELLVGGERLERAGSFVTPAIVRVPKGKTLAIAQEETFAPILYVFEIDSVEQAIAMNNAVSQGLSSAIFTNSFQAAERFLSPEGSDCGIANVNLGTSGAEIGGAFGGEKDTGGGRESGSDAWKAYMRRQTNTLNYGADLPLAQGVQFG